MPKPLRSPPSRSQSLTPKRTPKPASTNLQEKQVTTYIQKFRRTFKAPFTEPHSQGLVEKKHDAHHPLGCLYTTYKKEDCRHEIRHCCVLTSQGVLDCI